MAKAPAKRDDSETGVITKTRAKTQKPSMYKVLLLNDDYTPMEFVVHVLEVFFNKSVEESLQHMDDEFHGRVIVIQQQNLIH